MDFKIFFPTPLAEIEDKSNDNIDVCVRTEDGKEYTLVFITPDNLKSLMDANGKIYIEPDFKFIVVKQISEAAIYTAITEIVQNAALLQQYGRD